MADMPALATFADVQRGFEKPIPSAFQPKVEEFLARASRRLHMLVGDKLQPALDKAAAEAGFDPSRPDGPGNWAPTVYGFARDMVVQAAENKLRNFGGFSSESAGVFSVTREDYWAKGRITFDPDDLLLLQSAIDESFNETILGPIQTRVPNYRMP